MDHNVFVLAMSTLNGSRVSTYQFRRDGAYIGNKYEGLGQLEPVPQYVREAFGVPITHMVILATKETYLPVNREFVDPYDGVLFSLEGLDEVSAVGLFKRRMQWLGIEPEYIEIPICEEDPTPGLEELQQRIRNLYGNCQAEGGEWRLWIDTHGGFREVSMAMFGLMQMLAAPDEQDFASYSRDSGVANVIKRLTDGRDTVPVTGVYTIWYDPSRKGPNAIVDRTSFYAAFTKPAIEAYMNYGQFAQMTLRSNIKDAAGNIQPYAFISYRRTDAPKERYTFLGMMKKFGYRYWYDDSIDPQADWLKTLEKRNEESSVFIALVTRNYFSSYQCVRELKQAVDQKKLIVLAKLDDTSLSAFEEDITVARPGTSDKVTMTKDELAAITSRQHILLSELIREGVFQQSELELRFDKLYGKYPEFASIRMS